MKFFNLKGKILDLSTPKVMGILNITEDSFFDGGKYLSKENILVKTTQMIEEGASIIDVGAQSSRPGAQPINRIIEQERLLNCITIIKQKFPEIIISVDTYHSKIAEICVQNGADMINDISSGELDKQMFDTVAKLNVPYIMMHMQGTPEMMQKKPQYKDVTIDVLHFFQRKIQKLNDIGFQQIIIDPGFGFGKTMTHNYQLLNNLKQFQQLSFALLVGTSRKSMIHTLLDTDAQNSLNGTSVTNTIALYHGASILRVHDVKEAMECIKIVNFAKSCI
mgnify:CR=1 FL=1